MEPQDSWRRYEEPVTGPNLSKANPVRTTPYNLSKNQSQPLLVDFIHRPKFWLENMTFQKLGLFPFLGDGNETPTLLGPLGRGILNWTRFSSPQLRTETDSFSEMMYFVLV
jgi:hypothetical protein